MLQVNLPRTLTAFNSMRPGNTCDSDDYGSDTEGELLSTEMELCDRLRFSCTVHAHMNQQHAWTHTEAAPPARGTPSTHDLNCTQCHEAWQDLLHEVTAAKYHVPQHYH